MKKIILTTCLIIITGVALSQSTYSFINYTLPEGWYSKSSGENTMLYKKGAETTHCKIQFYKVVNTAVTTEAAYIQYRNELSGQPAAVKSWKPVQKEVAADWVNFASVLQTKTNGIVVFYSVANATQTVFFMVYTSKEGTCADEVDSIAESITVAENGAGQKESDKTKSNKTRAKKVRILPLKSLKALVY